MHFDWNRLLLVSIVTGDIIHGDSGPVVLKIYYDICSINPVKMRCPWLSM